MENMGLAPFFLTRMIHYITQNKTLENGKKIIDSFLLIWYVNSNLRKGVVFYVGSRYQLI